SPVVVLPTAAAEPAPSAPPARTDDTPPWAVDDAPVRAQAAPQRATAEVPAAVPLMAPEAAMALPATVADDAAPAAMDAVVPVAPPSAPAPVTPPAATFDDGHIADAEQWLELVTRSGLNGPSRQLAANAAFIGHRDGVLRLALAPGFEYLNSERSIANLAQALAPELGNTPRIVIETGSADVETLHERANRQKGERQSAAETAFMNDPNVQQLIQQQGARVVPDSIRPYDE
ncbi:DNA polymerase III subunit gamma/tau, partial [Xanthomonas campestris pv. campestris]